MSIHAIAHAKLAVLGGILPALLATVVLRVHNRHLHLVEARGAADEDRDGRLSPLEFSRIAVNRSDQPGPYKTSTRA